MRIAELRDGAKMRKDLVDRRVRQVRECCESYPVAMSIILNNVFNFAQNGIEDFASGNFTEKEIGGNSSLIADFNELKIKSLLDEFSSFVNKDEETEYQFSVNAIFCRIIKNSVEIEGNGLNRVQLRLVAPYKDPNLEVYKPNQSGYSR